MKCFKLFFGPDYVGWFDSQKRAEEAIPRLREQLVKDGVIRFVSHTDANSGRVYEVFAEKPPYDLTIEMVEMTEAEYMAIPATNGWVSGW